MSSLFDRLQTQLSAKPEGPKPQQQAIQKLVQAKTGKAGAGAGPAQSAMVEQAATGQAKQQLRAGEMAGRLKAEQLGLQEKELEQKITGREKGLEAAQRAGERGLATAATLKREAIEGEEELAGQRLSAQRQNQLFGINNTAEMQMRELATGRNISVDGIFSSFKRDSAALEDRKDAAKLEQLGFVMAMQDREYLDNLEQIATERDLRNQIVYEEEMNNLIWGAQLSSLMDDLDFKRGEDVKERDHQRQMAQIDIQSAIDMSRAMLEDEQTRQMWESGATAITTAYQQAEKAGSLMTGGGGGGASDFGSDMGGDNTFYQGSSNDWSRA